MTGFKPPSQQELVFALHSLPPRQKKLWLAAFIIFLFSFSGLVWKINNFWLVSVPAEGGELVEGVVGAPRLVNPLLASSDADRDLTALVYSGLVRLDSQGNLVPDLAKSFEISSDGLRYTFVLKNNLVWHDGKKLTAEDVEFTIQKVQDPLIKSPKRANFEGVKLERINSQIIRFTLRQPYSAFLENLTLGILPKHIWNAFDAEVFTLNQFNTDSVGSGPYKIKKIKKDSLGIPEYYDLAAFGRFALDKPKISNLRLRFYPSEAELLNGYRENKIESLAALPASRVKELEAGGARVLTNILPRVFGVFFNQNKSALFAEKEMRQALNLAIDKEAIIQKVLKGYGKPADGPLPAPLCVEEMTPAASAAAGGPEQAGNLLLQNGWTLNAEKILEKKTKSGKLTASFTIATADTPELKEAAEMIKQDWEKLGVRAELKIFEIGDLNQNIIRPRQYEALMFGEVVCRQPDLFSFWHSSQRLDPGLNIALYTNITADKILEQMRQSTSTEQSIELYRAFEQEFQKDLPAVFVYSPAFLYLVPAGLKNVTLAQINTPAERFSNIHQWYINTTKVWKMFSD